MKKTLLTLTIALCLVSMGRAQNVPAYVPKNGLVGYWPFNGNANDESGNNFHGTADGASLTTDHNGQQNKAYYFNGSAGIYNTNTTLKQVIDGNKPFSVGFWFNRDVSGNYPSFSLQSKVLFSFDGNNTYPYKRLRVEINQPTDTTTEISIGKTNFASNLPGESVLFRTNSFIQPNTWHYLFVTYDGANAQIYVDNVLLTNVIQGNSSMPGSMGGPDNYTKGFTIGNHYQNNLVPFSGKLDDIGVWNRALTQQEITALYTGQVQTLPNYLPSNGLVGWWPFNGNANDESGNGNNLSINGPQLTTDRFGTNNSCFSFNGTSDYLNRNAFTGLTDCSISIWINMSNLPLTGLGSEYFSNGYACCNGFGLKSDNNIYNKSTIITYGINGNVNNATFSPNLNTWYNFVLVKTTNSYKLFINGVLNSSGNSYTNSIIGIFGVGAVKETSSSSGMANFFKGKLDDIGFWNRALTQEEVTALYNGGNQQTLASTKVFVDAPSTVKQNDTLELAISTEALNTSDNVISYQTDFSYDTTRYSFLSNNLTGTLNPNANAVVNSTQNGKLIISYMTQTALNGAGSLLKLKFKSNNTLGQGIFGLTNFLYNNTTVSSLKNDTVNTLDGIPPTAKIAYSINPARKGDSLLITVSFSEKMADLTVPQLNLSGQNTLANSNLTKVNDSTYTYMWVVEKGDGAVNVNLATGKDLGENVVVASPVENPAFTVLPTLYGDIDTNKFVRAYDAALALQYSVNLDPIPAIDSLPWSNWRKVVANVDSVGNITANDAALILQYSAKLISSFPADASTRSASANSAEVIITKEADKLVFRAKGKLYGFNLYVKELFAALGMPNILDSNMIVASNINAQNYAIGLATAYAPEEDAVFMTIPLLAQTPDNLVLDMVINTDNVQQSISTLSGINQMAVNEVNIFPNPTKDVVYINQAMGYSLKIVDFNGKEVLNQWINSNNYEVSLHQLGSKGVYFLSLINDKQQIISTQKIILE